MSDDEHGFWRRAGGAYAKGQLTDFAMDQLKFFLALCVVTVSVLAALALPLQAAFETFQWLQNAEWTNFDWYMFLEMTPEEINEVSEFKGLNKIIAWLMDTWVTLIPAVCGAIAYSIMLDGY